MKSLYTISLGVCLAATPLYGSAEDLGPIVITPTRTPQQGNTSSATVYVMTAEEIEASGAPTTSELLRGIPGVQIEDLFGNGAQVTISLRGFSGTANANTLVLVNGRRMNYSDTATPDIHHIQPRDIERIEILAGSAGSLYGDQAVGGVINIITKTPEKSFHEVAVRSGSYDSRGIDFTSTMLLNSDLAYRISAGSFESDHYRDNNSQENTSFNGILEYAKDANSLFLEVQQVNDDLELPGALIEAEFEDDPTQSHPNFIDDFRDEEITVYRLGYARDFGDHVFSIDTTRRETDSDIRQSNRNDPSTEDGFTNRENTSINSKLYGSLSTSIEIPYVVGIDVEEIDYDLSIPFVFFGFPGVTENSNEQDVRSLYFQINPQLTDKLQLTFGSRRSEVENDVVDGFSFPNGIEVDDEVTVHEVGLTYTMDSQTRFKFRIDENFRFAKVNELTSGPTGVILDTQTGESYEFGIDLIRGNHQFIASVYRLDLENEIEFDPTPTPGNPFGSNINLDETRRHGITLSWLAQVSTNLAITTELGYVEAKFESGTFDGNDVSGVSDKIAKIRGDLNINDYVTTYLEVNYASGKFAQGDNANEFDELDSITVYNAGLGYMYKSWGVDFRINNLADESYAESINNFGAYFPSPERNYMITASYSFE